MAAAVTEQKTTEPTKEKEEKKEEEEESDDDLPSLESAPQGGNDEYSGKQSGHSDALQLRAARVLQVLQVLQKVPESKAEVKRRQEKLWQNLE